MITLMQLQTVWHSEWAVWCEVLTQGDTVCFSSNKLNSYVAFFYIILKHIDS